MTIGNADAAQAFQALSNEDQQARIGQFADHILAAQWDMKYRIYSEAKAAAEVILRLGLYDRYCTLSQKQRDTFFSKFFDAETAQTLFILDDLCPGIVAEIFATSSEVSFDEFSRLYRRAFPWVIHGSSAFINCLWRLFVQHGDPDFWNGERKPLKKGASGAVDQLMVQSAVILKNVYGEEKVTSLIEQMIRENPVSTLDFIRLVQSDLDTSTMPLSWVVQVINEEIIVAEGN